MQPSKVGDADKLSDYLRSLRTAGGHGSIEAFAGVLGVNKNTLGSYERGEALPDIDFLARFSAETGAELAELLRLRIEAAGMDPSVLGLYETLFRGPDHDQGPDDFEAWGRIGPAVGVPEHGLQAVHFWPELLRSVLGAEAEDLRWYRPMGEHMAPTIAAGDLLLIDQRAASRPLGDGIYLLDLGGGPTLRRCQGLPGGRARLTCDNAMCHAAVDSFDTEPEGVKVLGRVVWCGRPL